MKKRILLTLGLTILSGQLWAQSSSARMSVSTPSLTFNGDSGNVSQQPVTVTSTGSQPLVIQRLAFSNAKFSAAPAQFPVTLQPGQTMQFNVVAQPSPSISTGTLTVVSNASGARPVSLAETAAQASSAHQTALAWNAPSGGGVVASYEVDRAVSGSSHYSHIGSTPASTRNWTDTSPQAGQTYVYRIRALNHDGITGPPSNSLTFKIP